MTNRRFTSDTRFMQLHAPINYTQNQENQENQNTQNEPIPQKPTIKTPQPTQQTIQFTFNTTPTKEQKPKYQFNREY